jgi:RNA polymerase sigma-70 factor (ECF subfamily)
MELLFALHVFDHRPRAEVADFLRDIRPWAYRLALAVVGSPEAAEDVAQEAMVRAWRAQGTLARADDMRAWLRKVVVRQAITALKKHRFAELPEMAAPDQEPSMQVRSILATLPPETRALLALAYFEGLSYTELAETLGIPEGTVGSRLHTAKAAFRAQWGDR